MERILFVDRDGTILEEPEDYQVDQFTKMRFVEGVLPALKRLREAGGSSSWSLTKTVLGQTHSQRKRLRVRTNS